MACAGTAFFRLFTEYTILNYNLLHYLKGGVDTSRHPTMVFYELYRDVQFKCDETKGTNGLNEYLLEAEVEGKPFSGKACSKKVRVNVHVISPYILFSRSYIVFKAEKYRNL